MPVIGIIALIILGGIGIAAIAVPLKNRVPVIKDWWNHLFKKKP